MLSAAVLSTVQCSRRQPASPGAVYQSIEHRFTSGELARAEADARQASGLAAASGPLWEARFRIQHAKILLYQGHPQDALTLLQPALAMEPPDTTLAITRGALLSIALRRTGNASAAAQALVEAERICPDERACAEVRLAQGVVDLDGAKLDDANRALDQALTDARARGDQFLQMQALLNQGVTSLRQERYDSAVERFTDASAVANALDARVALEKATGNIGSTLYKLGDYRNALANSQLAADRAAALGIPTDEASWLNDVGLCQYQTGNLPAAKSSYEHSLKLARSIHDLEDINGALVALASLSLQQDDLSDALGRSQEAQSVAEQRGNPTDALRPMLIQALVSEKKGDITTAKAQLLSLQKTSSARVSIQWEAENALAQLSANTGDTKAANTWFRSAIHTFRSQRSSVADVSLRLPFVENGTGLYTSYMEFLIRNGKTDAALQVLDQGRAATLSDGMTPTTGGSANGAITRPNDVAKRFNATILAYCLRPGTSYLWAISPTRTQFIRLPGQETLRPLIASYSRAILASKDVLSDRDSGGYALYRDLVEPAEDLIGTGRTVYIVGDQAMDGLNFETLLTSRSQPHFWIEDVDIINARSLSLLAASHPANRSVKKAKRLLLIGDPVYKDSEYAKLTNARDEVTLVSQHFAPSERDVITGAAATPEAYTLSQPGDYSYVHFVAHGVVNAAKPLDSAVVLSAPANGNGPYKLYARQILDQKLTADLVTISSCYGSGVQSYSGEGLVGLAWAFLRAGSHNVIGALWEVSDVSTPRLMNDLYDGLARGNSPSSALRSAKLTMIHGQGVFRKPLYWAAFQLYNGS